MSNRGSDTTTVAVESPTVTAPQPTKWWRRGTRATYPGALVFNVATFLLPAVYGTLSRLWVAQLDASMVSVAETYTYIGVAVEVVNEGLPRAAYKVIGDRVRRSGTDRIHISVALIAVQCALGAILSLIICTAAGHFSNGFVPIEVRNRSVQYIRISAFSSLASALDVAVTFATRALDRPDVPLVISSTKTLVNIVLDLIFLSTVRVTPNVTVNTQAAIRLGCDFAGALAGLTFFICIAGRNVAWRRISSCGMRPLRPLLKPGAFTFAESAVRNALYLWLVSGIVSLGNDQATAWAIFNTIRWGLVMVPVNALEVTSSTFVGHEWGAFKQSLHGYGGTGTSVSSGSDPPVLASSDAGDAHSTPIQAIKRVTRPAAISTILALVVEVPLCLFMSLFGAEPFARYLSQSQTVAKITAHMWRTIDWCYIFYAVNTQLASILLATVPWLYFTQSLIANLLWVLPWAAFIQAHGLTSGSPWKWHAIVFGGSMVFSFVVIVVVLAYWRGGQCDGEKYVK